MNQHHTTKSGDRLDAPHAQPAYRLTRYATNFIAFIKRIATPDAFLISTLCLIIAQAVYAIVKAI